jgi:cytochrome c-type biogenesis protein
METRGAEVGAAAPEYAALTLAGDSVQLSDLEGTVVLLNVWATWCVPCREEIPALQTLYEQHSARGFEIVGVSIDGPGEIENVRTFAEGFNVTYTIWYDPADAVGATFQTIGVPTTFLLDRDGVVLWRHMGPVTVDDPGLNEALERALADS